ncbi:MAG: hypothetical protein ACI4R5_03960 [Acetatifactor sp.]
MPKNDNAQSIRLVDSLRKHVGEDIARDFEEKYPLSKSADIEKKYKWAENIHDFVEMFNKNETFASLEYISENKILFSYPECYCACVKRMPKELSMTWCY